MALFNPGSSSLIATTYEGALHEAIHLLRRSLKPEAKTVIGMEISEDSTLINCSVSLPLTVSVSNTGGLLIEAIDETVDTFTWTPDAASNATQSSLAALVLAIATKINAGTELTPGIDRCQLSISTDTETALIVTEFLLDDAPLIPIISFGIHPYIQNFT